MPRYRRGSPKSQFLSLTQKMDTFHSASGCFLSVDAGLCCQETTSVWHRLDMHFGAPDTDERTAN